MSFDRLTTFASKVASELRNTGVPFTPTGSSVVGWRVDEMLIDETTLSGKNINTELVVETDEIWLTADGHLKHVRTTLTVVWGRGGGSNRQEHAIVTELTETYARRRDGYPKWSTWIDKRGPGASANRGSRSFAIPAADRAPFLTVSSALSRLRPKP
jgi:hypothetical protein